MKDIKLVAVDVDGTFVRSDYTYDVKRFKRIFPTLPLFILSVLKERLFRR